MAPKARINWNLRRRAWILLDLFSGVVAVMAAYALQENMAVGWVSSNPSQPSAFSAALTYPWLLLFTTHVIGLHDPLGDRRRWLALFRILTAVLAALALYFVLLYAVSLQQLGRVILLRTVLFSVVLITVSRFTIWGISRGVPRKLGCYLPDARLEALNRLVNRHHLSINLVAPPSEFSDSRVSSRIVDFFAERKVDEVVVSARQRSPGDEDVWHACLRRGLQVTDLATFVEREFYRIPPDELTETWVLSVDLKWIHPFYLRFKRVLDVGCAVLIGTLGLPVFLLALSAIALEDGRPLFYSQPRTGFRGKSYRIWKLRSMRVDAEKAGARWAAKNDNRVTRVGRILRLTRLDELPQVWNVLRGEMSFIGPRPERPEFVEQLTREIPYFPLRHWVKPGITGWAQINYPYGATVDDAREKLAYDLYYMKHASLLLDVHITLRTLGAMMKGSR
jgi:exopolysaccharide biosynthesis polyprenyl glycosylphosphotransferase